MRVTVTNHAQGAQAVIDLSDELWPVLKSTLRNLTLYGQLEPPPPPEFGEVPDVPHS